MKHRKCKQLYRLNRYLKYGMTYSELLKRSIVGPEFAIWIMGPTKVGKECTITGIAKALNLKRKYCLVYADYLYFKAWTLSDFIPIPESIRKDPYKLFFKPSIYVFKSTSDLQSAMEKEIINNVIPINRVMVEYEDIERRLSYEIAFSISGNKKPSFIEIVHNSKYIVKELVAGYRDFLEFKGFSDYLNLLPFFDSSYDSV